MNPVSILPAPVAAQISGAGSFFGSCQIASGNFEDILNAVSGNIMPDLMQGTAPDIAPDIMQGIALNIAPDLEQDIMPELPAASSDSETLAEQSTPLAFAFQDLNKSEVLMQLQQILGEDVGAEAFERIINLLEKGTLSVQADSIDWDKDTFVKLTGTLLERLDIAIKQITVKQVAKESSEVQVQEYGNENDLDMEKFLNLIRDLLKTAAITPQEYETALKNPEKSVLPELLGELKKETVKLIETLESIENIESVENVESTESIESVEPRQAEQPRHLERPRQAEQPPQQAAEQPKQTELPQQAEQPIYAEQPRQVKQPQFRQAEQSKQAEQPQPAKQPKQAQAAEQPIYAEQPKQVKQPHFQQAEQPQPAKQLWQVEVHKQVEQYLRAEQTEPLLEELRVVSAEMEMGIKPKDKAKFHELINNLLDKGLINEQDLKSVMKIPAKDNESSLPIEPISKGEKNVSEKIEPVFIKNALEKIWTSLESENKVEKENIISKFKEIVETKSITVERTEIKSAKVEVEVRAIWDAGDLKIETVNPKTGEKLQSIPVANSHRMQERIHEFEIVRQVVSQAKFITTPTGEQRLTMQLRPDHLGQMNLRIVLNNGEMQIHARVESTTAQAALESHIGLLREGLEKQGINLERLEVSVEQKDRQDAFSLAERHEQQERHGKGRHHHRGKEMHLAVSVKNDENSDTGRRLGYNTMEYLA